MSVIIEFILIILAIAFSPLAYAQQSGNLSSSEQSNVIATDQGSDSGIVGPRSAAEDPACDILDPTCQVNDGNGGNSGNGVGTPPCDIQDPTCTPPTPPPCDIQDPTCQVDHGDGVGPSSCDILDPTCQVNDGNGGNGVGTPPCDIQDPTCTPPPPCDIQDPTCQDNGGCSLDDPACHPTHEICNNGGRDDDGDGLGDSVDPDCTGSNRPIENNCVDHIDNDHDGKTDRSDPDCSQHRADGKCTFKDKADPDCGRPGGPCSACVPGGAASIRTDNSPSHIADPSVISTALQITFEPSQAEATTPREDLCDDGLDNNHNGLIDLEDPACSHGGSARPDLSDFLVASQSERLANLSETSGKADIAKKIGQDNIVTISVMAAVKQHEVRTFLPFHNAYSPQKLTIERGSKVTWINEDPNITHGINLIDRPSGKTIFSYPVIRSGESAYYNFTKPGIFLFSDTAIPSMTGEITVLN